jgi:hypothetical protein
VDQRNPSTPSRTVSRWPARSITTGTQPPAIASAVVMPKCSLAHGARASSPYPVADQNTAAFDISAATVARGAFGCSRTGSPDAAAATFAR